VLYRRIKQQFEPITQAKLEVDTTSGTDAVVAVVEEYLTGGGGVPALTGR
jgi:hypothetical protein